MSNLVLFTPCFRRCHDLFKLHCNTSSTLWVSEMEINVSKKRPTYFKTDFGWALRHYDRCVCVSLTVTGVSDIVYGDFRIFLSSWSPAFLRYHTLLNRLHWSSGSSSLPPSIPRVPLSSRPWQGESSDFVAPSRPCLILDAPASAGSLAFAVRDLLWLWLTLALDAAVSFNKVGFSYHYHRLCRLAWSTGMCLCIRRHAGDHHPWSWCWWWCYVLVLYRPNLHHLCRCDLCINVHVAAASRSPRKIVLQKCVLLVWLTGWRGPRVRGNVACCNIRHRVKEL